MIEKLKKLRAAIEAQAELCKEIIDEAIAQAEATGADDEEPCPACGARGHLEDASTMGDERVFCTACGVVTAKEVTSG